MTVELKVHPTRRTKDTKYMNDKMIEVSTSKINSKLDKVKSMKVQPARSIPNLKHRTKAMKIVSPIFIRFVRFVRSKCVRKMTCDQNFSRIIFQDFELKRSPKKWLKKCPKMCASSPKLCYENMSKNYFYCRKNTSRIKQEIFDSQEINILRPPPQAGVAKTGINPSHQMCRKNVNFHETAQDRSGINEYFPMM